ncbi:MAG: hypothetical protein J7L95_05415 [Prolixibacteraceae bacterium]|nr:hypothetical protein [Prolixibacteraceae bacterium]
MKIGDKIIEKPASPDDFYIEFEFNLKSGDTDLQGWLIDNNGQEYTTYFVLVEKI